MQPDPPVALPEKRRKVAFPPALGYSNGVFLHLGLIRVTGLPWSDDTTHLNKDADNGDSSTQFS